MRRQLALSFGCSYGRSVVWEQMWTSTTAAVDGDEVQAPSDYLASLEYRMFCYVALIISHCSCKHARVSSRLHFLSSDALYNIIFDSSISCLTACSQQQCSPRHCCRRTERQKLGTSCRALYYPRGYVVGGCHHVIGVE